MLPEYRHQGYGAEFLSGFLCWAFQNYPIDHFVYRHIVGNSASRNLTVALGGVLQEPGEAFVELKAKILYDGDSGSIIDQYIRFCRVFDAQVQKHGRTKKAIEEIIRICKDQDLLKAYLSRKEAEEVMSDIFEKEDSMKLWAEELQAEGHAEGWAEGEKNRSRFKSGHFKGDP